MPAVGNGAGILFCSFGISTSPENPETLQVDEAIGETEFRDKASKRFNGFPSDPAKCSRTFESYLDPHPVIKNRITAPVI